MPPWTPVVLAHVRKFVASRLPVLTVAVPDYNVQHRSLPEDFPGPFDIRLRLKFAGGAIWWRVSSEGSYARTLRGLVIGEFGPVTVTGWQLIPIENASQGLELAAERL